MLHIVLSAVASSVITPAVLRAGDRVFGQLRTRTDWAGPGPEPASRFVGRVGLAIVAAVVWIAILVAVYFTLDAVLPRSL